MLAPDVTALPGATAEMGPRRVLVIHNPVAGRARARLLTEVVDLLRGQSCEVTERRTARRGDAEEFARTASARDFDLIAAAGGDGTVNEVVNGLVECADPPSLAVIPLGTTNVLALEIGLDPRDAAQIAATIAGGDARAIHLGLANGRHFMLMAGAGMDAQVVEGVNPALKRRAGKLAYVVESLRQAFGADFPKLQVRANGETYQGSTAVACKGRYYGGPFVAAPGARLDHPRLEVCILPKAGLGGMLRYAWALPRNKLADLPDVRVVSAESVTILGPRGAPLQADGDIIARLPAEISVARETIRLVMPT